MTKRKTDEDKIVANAIKKIYAELDEKLPIYCDFEPIIRAALRESAREAPSDEWLLNFSELFGGTLLAFGAFLFADWQHIREKVKLSGAVPPAGKER